MQLAKTFESKQLLLNEIGLLLDSRNLVYELKWNRCYDCGGSTLDDGFRLMNRVWYYLADLIEIRFMYLKILSAASADS